MRRLSVHQGRVLITTTPYTLGWLKKELHDNADTDPNIDLIQFKSTMNPAFPQQEYEYQKGRMPNWKFNMMYRGIFERPAGAIYDCFDENNQCTSFTIPDGWERYAGADFGGTNTVFVFVAYEAETDKYYVYDSYHKGNRTADEHVKALNIDYKLQCWGGAKSEKQWRNEFTTAGLDINEPEISDVELGINSVYKLLKENRLVIFEGLTELIADIETYARKLDENDEPTEKIENKNMFHHCDALRYFAGSVDKPYELLTSTMI